jgi:RimJ/RimL family protein N-acetyltransferase
MEHEPARVAPPELRTDRLLLRQLRADDREAFAAMNADPEVMRWIGSGALTPVASDGMRARMRREWTRTGHGLWALERTGDAAFLGFCGLSSPTWGGPALQGEVEVGWRLRREAWGHGYASEAARAALGVAWDVLELPSAIALVHPGNERSMGVGERLGMRVVGTARHPPSGWDVLVLRARRPDPPRRPDAAPGRAAPSDPR